MLLQCHPATQLERQKMLFESPFWSMKRHCRCQSRLWGKESFSKGGPFPWNWDKNAPIWVPKAEEWDTIPVCVCLVYLHQCILHLQRSPHFGSAFTWYQSGLNPWPSVASFSLTEIKHLRLFCCLSQCQDGHCGLCLRILPSCWGLLWHGHPCAGIHHMENFHLHPLNTHTCISNYPCILGGASAFCSFCPVIWNYSLQFFVRLSHSVLLLWACQLLL